MIYLIIWLLAGALPFVYISFRSIIEDGLKVKEIPLCVALLVFYSAFGFITLVMFVADELSATWDKIKNKELIKGRN